MAHLLMIDSWVTEMGQYLPEAIVRMGHSFTFVTRDLHHYLKKPLPGGKIHPLLYATNVLTTDTNDTSHLLDFVDRYRRLIADADLPNPAFGVASSWDEARGIAAEIGYPVVLKPADLCSSMVVTRA